MCVVDRVRNVSKDPPPGQDLASRADVLVHNFLPDVVARSQLSYEQLAKTNPRLIYAEITGYGSSGPLANTPSYDSVAAAVGGLWHITGEPNGRPIRVGRRCESGML